jgi:hypothetical protein
MWARHGLYISVFSFLMLAFAHYFCVYAPLAVSAPCLRYLRGQRSTYFVFPRSLDCRFFTLRSCSTACLSFLCVLRAYMNDQGPPQAGGSIRCWRVMRPCAMQTQVECNLTWSTSLSPWTMPNPHLFCVGLLKNSSSHRLMLTDVKYRFLMCISARLD